MEAETKVVAIHVKGIGFMGKAFELSVKQKGTANYIFYV